MGKQVGFGFAETSFALVAQEAPSKPRAAWQEEPDDRQASLTDTCEHCARPNAVAFRVNLGAHGRAVLCIECERAVLHGTRCPLRAECPENHGADYA